jgi:hypothetical protein
MTARIVERDFAQTCKGLTDDIAVSPLDAVRDLEEREAILRDRVEARLISAAWTLRRMPDREAGFLYARQAIWPEMAVNKYTAVPAKLSNLQTRKKIRPNPKEIDEMQPALDLLLLLPDVADRKLLFWAAWHQNGEKQTRIPWAKVRRSISTTASRWTLKRKYDDGLKWLAAIIALQG